MKTLTQKESRILEMLRFGHLKGREISTHLEISPNEVSRIIANIRKKFVKGNANASYIFLTKEGYTLEETPESLKYEGAMRLKRGTSIILNGKHIFTRYRQINLGEYNNLRIEYYPKASAIANDLYKE